ncbi:helix-hairpin-helix domain-containing protein [Intestinimonas sp. MSJ-38]|uniref:ComEA family DNA-binding protein n=1 Tax=Intestinimonas sp. MSJ-38 TaxID=2841532 RepID=UPI001C101ADF|nr:helix-hairpin-helix domain-containing protein [Intestinimonas sp. MSJ-38]MBU5432115.1 helix-hairpin-helix domain-containing protein [Intestinimonas sp. MSJ-38]
MKKRALDLLMAACLLVCLGFLGGRMSVMLEGTTLSLSQGAQLVRLPELALETYQVEENDETPGELRVNINEAGEEELCQLPQIGPARAKNILEYREKYGPFASIEEIRAVSGIGDGIFQQIREHITVD